MSGRGRNRSLLAWYDASRRNLPWRETRDRWAVLVSEVMLQQTQVSRVVPVFERFMASYPSPDDFAEASPEDVIAVWGGLGYLRRARNLRAAARRISQTGWPDDLTQLPGVGPYTAAAVAAFADGRRVAAVDVNLRRVLSRWEGRPLTLSESMVVGDGQVDPDRPGDWNQAMMDLGASICRPRNPQCEICPVDTWCSDPGIRQEAGRQTPYEGSVRQARAAVLKKLAHGPIARGRVGVDLAPETVQAAIAALESEGAILDDRGTLRLA
ncbi:MAG: A/G-specific adenine glycosylase [Acidimicrobiia bacterium]